MDELLQLLLIAFGLSVDAAVVASTASVAYQNFRVRDAVVLSSTFGLFQGGMALIGWLGGATAEQYIQTWDHWLAFVVLAIIGLKMIRDSFRETNDVPARRLTAFLILSLALATSVDALAVGVTLGVLRTNIWLSCGLIAVVTLALSLLAALFSQVLGRRFGRRLETAGGFLLIMIGAQILYQHLY